METVSHILEKVPEMAALLLLVWLFLKAQTESRKEYLVSQERFVLIMQEEHKENMSAREVSRAVITENTRSNMELTSAVRALEIRIKEKI